MAKETETKSSGGISVVGLLGVVFVALKLCGVINWSWWWVTVPFWGGIAVVITITIIAFVVTSLIEVLESKR
ncbi:hypothetical protein D3C76_190980 [compost metagenome]